MDKNKLRVRLIIISTVILVSLVFVSGIRSYKNMKVPIGKTNMEDIISLITINDTIIALDENTDKSRKNEITDANENQIELEDIEIGVSEINQSERANDISEENVDNSNDTRGMEIPDNIVPKAIQNKRVDSISNRGESIEKKKQQIGSGSLNQYVLDIISTYTLEEGAYPYLLNNDFKNYNGVTEDIYYKGDLILKANPSGDRASNCTGISFEVFFKAMQKRNKDLGISEDDFNGMTKDELFDMALTWFVAKGPKSESNLVVALEKYGLGTRINDLENARPGDFIDLSRENNSGHAVVFIDWIRENKKIIGLKLWSSQGSTNGISYKKEYFNIKDKNGNKYGGVIKDSLHIVRVNPVSEYK